MRTNRYSDHSITFMFTRHNGQLEITLYFPQIRLTTKEITINLNTLFSICMYKEWKCFNLVILGFGISLDLEIEHKY